MTQVHKLTIVTRKDITPGYQIAQAIHASNQFSVEHTEIFKEWHKDPYLAVLSTQDENSLINLIDKAKDKGIKVSVFREPDIDNSITAIALEPSDLTRRLTSSLPLALKEFNLFGVDKHTKREVSYA